MKDINTYEIDIRYGGQEKAQIEITQIYENTVKKQAFQILKQQYTGENETAPLANAGFSIYLIKDLSIVKDGKITKNQDGSYTLNDESAKGDARLQGKANKNGTYKIGDLVNYYYKIQYIEETMKLLGQGKEAYYPYDLKGETRVKDYSNSQEGETTPEIISNNSGYVKSPKLAYGEYIVIETSVPHNKEAIVPFTITIETNDNEAQSLRYVVDPDFKSRIKIYTKDIETKQTILKDNAKFVVKNLDTGELVTYKTWSMLGGNVEYGTYETPYQTNKKGYTIVPNELGVGNYELIQLNAPEGYVLNGYEGHSENGEIVNTPEASVKFEIGTNQMYYVDNELNSNVIVTVEENKTQVGTLEVKVIGEKLIDVDKHGKQEESDLTEDLEQEPYGFQYEKDPLEGVQIGLYAKENIYSGDNQGTILYNQNELVQTKSTNKEGKAHFDNVPIGKYYVKETKTIYGFIANEEEKEIEVVYGKNEVEIEKQKTPVTKHKIEKESKRQTLIIQVSSIDKETGEPIEGQKIGIYAKEDIYDKDGNLEVKKDELIEIIVTGKDGTASTTADLPLSTYYAKEIKPAPGYTKNDETIDIDGTKPGEKDEDGKEIVEPEEKFQSTKTSIQIKAIDKEGEPVEGSVLQIVDESGNIVEEWTSGGETKQIQKLKTGITYTIKQKTPKAGYASIEEIHFKLQGNGDLEEQTSEEHNTIKVIHYETKLEIHLTDKATKEEIVGIQFEIYKAKENTKANNTGANNEEPTTKAGEKIGEFTIEENGSYKEKLPIGEYILRQKEGQEELLQQKGYAKLPDKTIKVKDTKELQIVNLEQDYTKLEIEIIDKDTKAPIPGIKVEIYEVITKEDGTKEIGKKIEEITTKEGQTIVERLPVGEYILKEVEGQEELYEKGYVTNEKFEFKIEDKEETQKITIEQAKSKLEINITDEEGKVPGVIIEIKDKETGEVVKEIITTEDENIIDKLPLGDYIIHIKDVPYDKGYVKGKDKEITIIDTTETQKINLTQDYTKVEIRLLDIDTKEPVIRRNLSCYRRKRKRSKRAMANRWKTT